MSGIEFRLIVLLHLVLIAASVRATFLPDGYSRPHLLRNC